MWTCVCISDKYSETQTKLDKTEATIRGLQNSVAQLEERNKKLQSDCEKCRSSSFTAREVLEQIAHVTIFRLARFYFECVRECLHAWIEMPN